MAVWGLGLLLFDTNSSDLVSSVFTTSGDLMAPILLYGTSLFTNSVRDCYNIMLFPDFSRKVLNMLNMMPQSVGCL